MLWASFCEGSSSAVKPPPKGRTRLPFDVVNNGDFLCFCLVLHDEVLKAVIRVIRDIRVICSVLGVRGGAGGARVEVLHD